MLSDIEIAQAAQTQPIVEIAEKAGIPINTVKTRISRAKGLIIRMMLDIEEQ